MAHESWDHTSLFAAGTSPKLRSPTKRAAEEAQAWWGSRVGSESRLGAPDGPDAWDSPLEGWEVELIDRRAFRQLGPAVRHSGWLLKAYGNGPARQWHSRFVYLTADRLCYTPDPDVEGVRYLPLDRIPVRALPRGYGPKLGVTVVEDRQVDRSHPQFSPKKSGCVFSVACGSHTLFFSAPSPAEARAWVDAISGAWVQCVKHTARGTHSPTGDEAMALKEARFRKESELLHRSLAEAEQQRLRESMAVWQVAATAAATVQPVDVQVACYDIEVVTGGQPDAGTTSRVYLELCGTQGNSGEHRLMYREGAARAAFVTGATDAFKLHCQLLGELLKVRVYHSNAGPHPSWFLEEVRVRRQDDTRWTVFPCARWLAVHQDDGRVMRELTSSGTQAAEAPAPVAARLPAPAIEEEPQPVAAERVVQPTWYTVVVCTSSEEGAGLAAADADGDGSSASAAVFLVMHGGRGSSQRVKLPSQAGDFERGQEDVFRVQLPCVGALEKLMVGVSSASKQVSWLLEQVEVTDETTGETVFFPCSAWLGSVKGAAERNLLGSRINPREARREVARLQQQAEAAKKQLTDAQLQLTAAQAAVSSAEQASRGQQEQLEAQLGGLEAEAAQLKKTLSTAQSGAAAAESQVEALRVALAQAEERAASLQAEQEAGRQRAGADASRAAQLTAQVHTLHDELAEAQEASAGAAARARKCEAEAQRAKQALEDLRTQHERHLQDKNASGSEADSELRRLRAEVAAKAAELQEVKHAEAEYAAECDKLSRDLAAERLRARENLEAAEQAAAAAAASLPSTPTSAKLQATYRVRVHTSGEPSHAGTCRPVWVELLGTRGSTGAIALDRQDSATCFAAGASDVFKLEASDVGELQQLNIWVDVEGPVAAPRDTVPSGSDDASWHLDTVEVAPQGVGPPRPSYFVCRKWLDARCGYRAELAATTRNPREEEVEYQVMVYTSTIVGCGTSGNVCLDLQGDKRPSGVLTLRNKGGSFRPGQADAFTFRLPSLGALSELRVGHDGRKEWHLERVEVVDTSSGTTYFFPCARWVPAGAMSRALQLRGYTTDPGSLPVRYRAELAVEGVEGTPPPPDGLRVTLFGARGESGVQHVDASHAAPGRSITAWFEAPNVGAMEKLRIGFAPAAEGQQSSLLVSRITLTNMVSGDVATFHCSEWLRSSDPYDLELDALDGAQEQEETACVYRLEVQTSDVRKAGTPGSVFLTIIGDACTIGPYQLSNTEAEHFQRGQLDIFEIDGAPDCGRLRQIEVRHDGQGRSNNWHLAWVKVSNCTTGAVAMFKCNRWVDKRSLADPGVVAVVVALAPDRAAAAAGVQRNSKDKALMGSMPGKAGMLPLTGTGIAAAAAAKAPLPRDQRMEMDAGVEGVIEAAVGGPPAGLPGYRVVFHTTRTCGSGTRAKVHFELSGSSGSSGVLNPRGTPRSFGAGRLDIFDFPQLPFLGELRSARVGTDASGFFPSWHLALVVVTHLPTGRVWQFSCYNWIDKKCNYSRWLQLDSIQEGPANGGSPRKLATAGPSLADSWHGSTQRETAARRGSTFSQHLPSQVSGMQQHGGRRGDSPSHPSAQQQYQQQQQQQQQHQQQQHQQQYGGSPAGSSYVHGKSQAMGGRPGSPLRTQGWQQQAQQRGSAHMLHSSSSGIPGSPLIRAANTWAA